LPKPHLRNSSLNHLYFVGFFFCCATMRQLLHSIQQRTDARRLAGEIQPMAMARSCRASLAAAQRLHKLVIGWLLIHQASPALPG
jgi:hypothetical protein